MSEFAGGTHRVTEGEWKDWIQWRGDPFEDHNGPFYYRHEDDGAVRCAFVAEKRHMNGGGFMHGGCMMTFADYALFCIGKEALGDSHAVTLTMSSEFVSAGHVGDFVEATGEVVKAGKSVIFIRGQVSTRGETLMTFTGVVKRVRSRP